VLFLPEVHGMKKVNVALAGSGQLYFAFVGALICLKDRGIEIAEISGTSGGAIIAAAISSGLDPEKDIVALAKATLPIKSNLFDFSLLSILRRWGLIRGNKIENKFNQYLHKKLGDAQIPLYITASNITARKVRIFSSASDPGFSTARAIRASISLPFIFEPVIIDGDFYVDGGWMKNMPSDVFSNGLPVLAFRTTPRAGITTTGITALKNYLVALFESIIDGDRAHRPQDHVYRVYIPTRFNPLNFNVSEREVDLMIEEGHRAASEWLEQNEEKIF
jgi:predicted acylesterase/phospholipase RssA